MYTITRVIATVLLTAGVVLTLSAQFKIQVAAYVDAVPESYFTEAGLEGVYGNTDNNNIQRYFYGNFTDIDEAEMERDRIRKMGFRHAQVIDLEEQKALCGRPCPFVKSTSLFVKDGLTESSSMGRSTNTGAAYSDPDGLPGMSDESSIDISDESFVQPIFFAYNSSALSAPSKRELERLKRILLRNPGYQVRFMAYTDDIGSQEYNISLSKRRAAAARRVLRAAGIDNARITQKLYGKLNPIARNRDDEGNVLAEGMRYNRRVTMVITDARGEVVHDIVRPVTVPDHLKAGSGE